MDNFYTHHGEFPRSLPRPIFKKSFQRKYSHFHKVALQLDSKVSDNSPDFPIEGRPSHVSEEEYLHYTYISARFKQRYNMNISFNDFIYKFRKNKNTDTDTDTEEHLQFNMDFN